MNISKSGTKNEKHDVQVFLGQLTFIIVLISDYHLFVNNS